MCGLVLICSAGSLVREERHDVSVAQLTIVSLSWP